VNMVYNSRDISLPGEWLLASQEEINSTVLVKRDLDLRRVAAVLDCSIKLYKTLILMGTVIVTFIKSYDLYI
jgi:hypothetical protein